MNTLKAISTRLRRAALLIGAGMSLALPAGHALAVTGTAGSVASASASYSLTYTDVITPVLPYISAAFTSGALPKYTTSQPQPVVSDILSVANHTMSWKASANCSSTAKAALNPLDGSFDVGAWCWESSDQDAGRTPAASDWIPQGVTSSVEAAVGGYTGSVTTVVSWYRPDPASADPDNPTSTGARLTFVNKPLTSTDATYRRVILVKPGISAGKLTIADVLTHAGAVTWYGNYLYVMAAEKIRVFDIRHIYSLYAGSSTAIGPDGSGHLNAYAYPFAMFEVAEFDTPCQLGMAVTGISSALCTSGAAIDFTNNKLVTFEHRATAAMTSSTVGARIVSWPLDASGTTRGLLTRVSGQAVSTGTVYTTPTPNLQGVVRNGAHIYMSRSAPTASGTIYHTDTSVGAAVDSFSPWMPNAESISYTTAVVSGATTGRLWSVNETNGARWLLWVYTHALGGPAP